MRLARILVLGVSAWLLLHAGTALACHLKGKVVCDFDGTPVAGVTITVQGPDFVASANTDAEGIYYVYLPYSAPGFTATIDLSGAGGGSVVSPSQPAAVVFPEGSVEAVIDWRVNVPGCAERGCWLTGGGMKFSTIAGINVAERGQKINFGGNVNPSCSPLPGEGGQWTHVDHGRKLFFQGTSIVVDECGNVPGIEPGSTSPVTPYNYILYHGTGRLKGISGNRLDAMDVCFTARAEDRNEPGGEGSNGQRAGAYVDKYYLRVFDCMSSATLLVLEDGPGSGMPVFITDGNLQLHISSCSP